MIHFWARDASPTWRCGWNNTREQVNIFQQNLPHGTFGVSFGEPVHDYFAAFQKGAIRADHGSGLMRHLLALSPHPMDVTFPWPVKILPLLGRCHPHDRSPPTDMPPTPSLTCHPPPTGVNHWCVTPQWCTTPPNDVWPPHGCHSPLSCHPALMYYPPPPTDAPPSHLSPAPNTDVSPPDLSPSPVTEVVAAK